MMSGQIPVVYIAGCGRSGSTLVELMMAQFFEVFPCGELRYFWDRMIENNETCSCGASIGQCGFWSGFPHINLFDSKDDFREFMRLKDTVDKNINLAFGFDDTARKKVLSKLYALYRYAYDRAGCPIIDSSKHPSYLALLASDNRFKVYCLHVVRDARGVCYSWSRIVRRPEVRDRDEFLPRFGLLRCCLQWNLYNGWIHLNRRRFSGYARLGYDAFCSDVKGSLEECLGSLGLFVPNRSESVEVHSAGGNPLRFRPVEKIAPDLRWRSEMSRIKKFAVSILTLPAKLMMRAR